jgi:hypothetical protein
MNIFEKTSPSHLDRLEAKAWKLIQSSSDTGARRFAEAPRFNSQPVSGKDEEPQNGGDPTTEDRSG